MSTDARPSGGLNLTVSEEIIVNKPATSVYLSQQQCNSLKILTGSQVVIEAEDGTAVNGPVRNTPRSINVENDAIVLTSKQKDRLGVEAGDTVTVRDYSTTSVPASDVEEDEVSSPGVSDIATDVSDTEAEEAEEDEEQMEIENVTYKDIGGLDSEVEAIKEMVELPLTKPEMFEDYGVDPPSGVLLYGPPGTGKTMIAKAISNEADARFLSINGPEIVSKYKGESEKQLRELFQKARKNGPAIIFFDEIDAIAGERDEENDVENRLVGQLLSLMDGVGAQENIIVVGATNRVDALDSALRRGGRFDREIEIGVPDKQGRREILGIHTEEMPLSEEVGLDALAERTYGFVGADLAALTREAAMYALNRARTREDVERVVTTEDFNRAMRDVDPSAMREFVAEEPTTGFGDVGGLKKEQRQLQQNVEWPLQYPDLFDETKTTPPNGVLLHGPAGSGKTLLARALAGESQVNFIQVDSTSLIDKYVGESEEAIREVFQQARRAAPSVIFLDNIGSIAGESFGDGASAGVTERMVSQLLTELDNLNDNPNVTVIAATERPDSIDSRLLQPNRLEEEIELPLPDSDERREIVEIHVGDKPLSGDVNMEELVERLSNETGSTIESVVRRASMEAIDRAVSARGIEAANENADEIEINWADFRLSLDAVLKD